MKIHTAHADTCLPDYWSGHHRPHVGIVVYNGMSFADVRRAIRDEVRMGCVMGSDDDATCLASDVVRDPAYADELTRAVYASINRDIEPARKGARNAFPDLEKSDDDSYVMAYFVFMREGERRSIETHVDGPDHRIREGFPFFHMPAGEGKAGPARIVPVDHQHAVSVPHHAHVGEDG